MSVGVSLSITVGGPPPCRVVEGGRVEVACNQRDTFVLEPIGPKINHNAVIEESSLASYCMILRQMFVRYLSM